MFNHISLRNLDLNEPEVKRQSCVSCKRRLYRLNGLLASCFVFRNFKATNYCRLLCSDNTSVAKPCNTITRGCLSKRWKQAVVWNSYVIHLESSHRLQRTEIASTSHEDVLLLNREIAVNTRNLLACFSLLTSSCVCVWTVTWSITWSINANNSTKSCYP